MSEVFDFIPENEYLKIIWNPPEEYPINKYNFTLLVEKCLNMNYTKMLMDATAYKLKVPIFELFEVGTFVVNYARDKNLKIAFLASPEALDPDYFFEKVVTSRGIDIKVATSQDEALSWLLS